MSNKVKHVLGTLDVVLNVVAVVALYLAPAEWVGQMFFLILGVLGLNTAVEAVRWYRLPAAATKNQIRKNQISLAVASLMLSLFAIVVLLIAQELGLNLAATFRVALAVLVVDTAIEVYGLYKMP